MRILLVTIMLAAAACGGPGGGTDEDATDTVGDEGDAPEIDAPEDTAPEVECTSDEDCDDGDPCTTGICDTDSGTCTHEPADEDEDGYAASQVSGTACGGTDCDDADETVYPGSTTRICEEDGDCNTRVDSDNDGDGHERVACGGDDCADEIGTVFPGALPGCGTDPADPLSDLDCNGRVDSDNDGDTYVAEACTDGDDCDDSSADVHPGAAEVCADGIDQDCDDLVDGPGTRVPNVQFGIGIEPSVVWLGTESGVSWVNTSVEDLFYWTIPLTGPGVSRTTRVTTGSVSPRSQSMAWTGSEVGLAWYDSRYSNAEIFFRRISPGGALQGSEVRVTSDLAESSSPSLAFTGSEFGLCWHDSRDGNPEIYFARLTADGTKLSSDVRITFETNQSYTPSLAWSGSEFGVGWYDLRDGAGEIYLARISAAGSKIGSDTRLTTDPAQSNNPDLVWTGSEYGLAWVDYRSGDSDVFFATVSPAGIKTSSDIRITTTTGDSMFPGLVWAGDQFHLVWSDSRDYNDEIYHAGLDAAGSRTSSDYRVTIALGVSTMPDLAWTGSELAVVWEDHDIGLADIVMVTYLSFCD